MRPGELRRVGGGAPVVPEELLRVWKRERRKMRFTLLRAIAEPVMVALACGVALAALTGCGQALAQTVETPEARSFAIRVEDGTDLTIGVAEPLPGAGLRIGFAVSCERASGKLELLMSFGSVPLDRRVQAAAGVPGGRVERFGPVVRGGGPAAGFHDPRVVDREDVLRFIDAAFAPGSLVSNGHNSIWNRVGARENREARAVLRRCAGAGE